MQKNLKRTENEQKHKSCLRRNLDNTSKVNTENNEKKSLQRYIQGDSSIAPIDSHYDNSDLLLY